MAETALNPILAQAQKVLNTVAPSSASSPLKTVESDSSGTSTSNRVTSITQINSPSATTFESTIDGVNVGMADSARLTPLAIASEKEAASIAGATAEAVVSQSVNSNIIASIQGVAEIQAQLDTKRIFEAAGGVDELVKLATGMKVARDDQFAKQEAVRKNVDVDFSDNPIQWLVNKFTIGALGEEESVATATVQMYEQAIGNISSLASSTDRAINDVKITATVATLAAEKEKISQIGRAHV